MYFKAWVGLGQPEVRAPPIIATRAVLNVWLSCDASVTWKVIVSSWRTRSASFVSKSYEEPWQLAELEGTPEDGK